jgi:hypothetical protein
MNGQSWPQSRFEICAEEKNVFPLPGIEPKFPFRLARSLLTILTELSRFLPDKKPVSCIIDHKMNLTM